MYKLTTKPGNKPEPSTINPFLENENHSIERNGPSL